MKEQDKITATELDKSEISNMPDREFKVMITKTLLGLILLRTLFLLPGPISFTRLGKFSVIISSNNSLLRSL